MSCAPNPTLPFDVTGAPSCPLCSGRRQKIVSEYKEKTLAKCLDCGVGYVLPQPSRTEVHAHFQEYAPIDDRALKLRFERNRARPLSQVARYIQKKRAGGVILDIACGTGLFLADFFRDRQWHTCGTEISPAAAAKATTKGVEIRLSDIHSAGFQTASLDVITVLDAFYYFPEPLLELGEYSRILRGDGLLLIELPLSTSRIWRTTGIIGKLLSGHHEPLLSTSDHLYYYTPRAITLLLEKSGFQILDIHQLPSNRQESLLRDLMVRVYFALSRVLEFLSGSRIFLGPRFFVAARKIPAVNLPKLRP